MAVAAEVMTIINAGRRNANTVNPVLYGNKFNQFRMKYQAIGKATTADINASHK